MMVNRPTLHPMAAAALRSLETKGLKPTADHILWLQDAARRIRKAHGSRIAEMVDWPIDCGGVLLYKLSIIATEWLMKLPPDMQDNPFVQAFACAHSHDEDALRTLVSPWKIRIRVMGWKSRIKASRQALAAVLAIQMGDNELVDVDAVTPRKSSTPAQDQDQAEDFGMMVLALCKRFDGTSPQFWACEASIDYALEMLGSIDEQEVSGYQITMGVAFRSIVAHIEKELTEASNGG